MAYYKLEKYFIDITVYKRPVVDLRHTKIYTFIICTVLTKHAV